MLEHIVAEIERREILIQAIDNIIESQFTFVKRRRLKRGPVQERIFKLLGVRRNNVLCQIVNERMRARGYETIINQGDQYYRNVSLLPTQCA